MRIYYHKFVLFIKFHIEHADCDAGSYGIRLYLTVGNNSDMFDSFLKLGYLRLDLSLLIFSLVIFTVFGKVAEGACYAYILSRLFALYAFQKVKLFLELDRKSVV